MADIETSMKPASAVFIDVPNVASAVPTAWYRLPWKRLLQAIASTEVLVGTELMQATAYLRTWNEKEEFYAKKFVLSRAVTIETRAGDDIDSLIIEDMWATLVKREQESIHNGRLHYPLQMRFLLISGDSDYLRSIRKMREIYGQNLELEFFVFSWADRLSEDLRESANGYFYIDDMRGFRDLKR